MTANTGDAGRDGDGVYVASESTVLTAFLDGGGNYSVCGYANRMANSLGLIYLGLDDGTDYQAQATRVNAAISAITAADAFQLAFDATKQVLGSQAAVNDNRLSELVLAAVSGSWFAFPDDDLLKTGGVTVWGTPQCPGDFAPTSGHIFFPKPDLIVRWLGPRCGRRLKTAALRFVRRHRPQPPTAPLARVVFDSISDDDLAASTLIGVMMGFLPTVQGNFCDVVGRWRKSGLFSTLRSQFQSSTIPDLHARALSVLALPLRDGMRAAPTPPRAWRTAVKVHYVGDAQLVEVSEGETVSLRIAEATQQGNLPNVFAIFGGDRSQTPHPTHACPGYAAATGVLLGMIAGLMAP